MARKRANAVSLEPAEISEETPLWVLLQNAQKTIEEEKTIEGTSEESDSVTISLEGATGRSLIYYLSMLKSYERLINKAMDLEIDIPDVIIERLMAVIEEKSQKGGVLTVEMCIKELQNIRKKSKKSMKGVQVDEHSITISGFDPLEDHVRMDAYRSMLILMEEHSRKCVRFKGNYKETDSEKYDMYQLFIKISATGPDHSDLRKYALEKLDGYAAFPNEEARTKWIESHGRDGGKRKQVQRNGKNSQSR